MRRDVGCRLTGKDQPRARDIGSHRRWQAPRRIQRDARREAEGWARTMGQRPIRWELLDDNMALGRIDDHVVLVRSIMLPPANHWT